MDRGGLPRFENVGRRESPRMAIRGLWAVIETHPTTRLVIVVLVAILVVLVLILVVILVIVMAGFPAKLQP